MKNRWIVILALFLMIFGLVGCNKNMEDTLVEIPGEPIRINYNDWPPDMLTYLAQEKGFFRDAGVNVELVWVNDFDELISKRDAGELDIATFTLLDFVTEKNSGANGDAQVFLIEDYSNGADAILTMNDSGINEVIDLKGKKIAVDEGTVSEFFLNVVLADAGLSLDDIERINATSDDVPALLESGEVDAGVAYEPVISQIVNGNGKVVIDSSAHHDAIVDVYVASQKLLETRKDDVAKVASALLEAGKFVSANPEAAAEIMKEPLGIEASELVESFEKLKIPTLRENKNAFDRSSAFESLFNLTNQSQQYLQKQGLIEDRLSTDSFLNSSIVDTL